MSTAAIRKAIAEACRTEASTNGLRHRFAEHLDDLGRRLTLPVEQPAEALVDFTRRYIQFVPEFIDEITLHCEDQVTLAYLNMAEDFFLAPPTPVAEEEGLMALLDEAFLAQRVLEELNDRLLRFRGRPLLPLDMTRANIIVHHLIGDRLASRLEALIEQCLSLLWDNAHRFAQPPEAGLVDRDWWDQLPCMSRDANIDLRLEVV